jgi:hypothetical protein
MSGHLRFMMNKVTLGLVFTKDLGLPVCIPQSAPNSFGAGARDQIVGVMPYGLSLNPSQETKNKGE